MNKTLTSDLDPGPVSDTPTLTHFYAKKSENVNIRRGRQTKGGRALKGG